METRAATIMRAMAAVTVIAAVIGLYAAQLQAAPASIAAPQQNFTPFKQLVLGVHRYDSTNGYLPACPSGLFYACHYAPYGGRFCGCWPGGDRPACPGGYHYACPGDASGNTHCACW